MEKGFAFKKSLGQNFLNDRNILNKIIESIDYINGSLIVEIGPGSGFLTKELLKFGDKVLCFEIDQRLKPTLDTIQQNNSNLDIIYEDFLKVDLKSILNNYKYKKLFFIANIPYYITTPIIKKIHEETDAFEIILMVQKEVANRINANVGTRDYNSLSVFLQFNYDISKVSDVSRNCFFPKPNVDSAIIKFIRKNKNKNLKDENKFYRIVNDSFKYKRKNIKNNLKNYNLEKLNEILKKYNKDLNTRAENITIDEFIDISNNID